LIDYWLFAVIIDACTSGDLLKLKRLFQSDPLLDINYLFKEDHDRNGLMLASTNGHARVISFLLCQGTNVNHQDKERNTALHLAAERGHVQVITTLLKDEKIQPNLKNNIGCTPLHVAIKTNHMKVFIELVNNDKVDVNETNSSFYTALMLAIEKGNTGMVAKLIKTNKVNVNFVDNKSNKAALDIAVAKGQFEIVVELVKRKEINVNRSNNQGDTLLHVAARAQSNRYPLEASDMDEYTKLLYAKYGKLSNGMASPEDDTCTYAQIAAELMKTGKIDVNQKNEHGETALHVATKKGSLHVVIALLHNETVEVNMPNSAQETALHIAAKKGDAAIIAELVKSDAIQVNKLDQDGNHAVFIAAREGNVQAVLELLKGGKVEVDMKDQDDKGIFDAIPQSKLSQSIDALSRLEDIKDEKVIKELLVHLFPMLTPNGSYKNSKNHHSKREEAVNACKNLTFASQLEIISRLIQRQRAKCPSNVEFEICRDKLVKDTFMIIKDNWDSLKPACFII